MEKCKMHRRRFNISRNMKNDTLGTVLIYIMFLTKKVILKCQYKFVFNLIYNMYKI